MTKFEFMTELQGLLQDIALEERNAALDYYEDYFEDAGIENVDKVIAELGTPQRVAAIIKSDLNDSAGKDYDKVEYTENGYRDRNVATDKFEVVNSEENKDTDEKEKEEQKQHANFNDYNREWSNTYSSQNSGQNESYQGEVRKHQDSSGRKDNSSKIILIILLCVFGLPVILPVICGIGAGILGIAAGLLGVFIAIGVSGVALLVTGGIIFVVGVISLLSIPVNGMFLVGAGLLSLGLGILLMVLAGLICSKWIPGLIRGCIYLCKLPFKKRRECV